MLNFNGLIMCTLPLHSKINISALILIAVLNDRFIVWYFFSSLLHFLLSSAKQISDVKQKKTKPENTNHFILTLMCALCIYIKKTFMPYH